MLKSIFDQVDRTELRDPFYCEGPFTYLNITARPEANEIRALIERWVSDYPTPHRKKMTQWLRNDDKFHDAFFELFVYHIMRKLGCDVEVEPQLPDGKTPDFLVREPDGRQFYLEASISKGLADDQVPRDNIKNAVRDCINGLESPQYFIGLRFAEEGREEAGLAKLIEQFAKDCLHSLETSSYTSLESVIESGRVFRNSDWIIELYFTPRKRPVESATNNTLGIETIWAGFNETPRQLMAKVKKKAVRYRDLPIRYIVAVNSQPHIANTRSFSEALYGKLATSQIYDLDGSSRIEVEHEGGLFWNDHGVAHTNVSGVLGCIRVCPWNLASRELCLYHHPDPGIPMEGILQQLPQAYLLTQPSFKVHRKSGITVRELLELPKSWPFVE